jgi:hypothetical protein
MALRIELKHLIAELMARDHVFLAQIDDHCYWEALQFASETRELPNY